MANLDEVLARGVDKIYPHPDLLKRKIDSGDKLRIYFGIDPTTPNIHIGHTIPLRKLRQFQDIGNKIILLIGDFTAKIGDPTGKTSQRVPLTKKVIEENVKTYIDQAKKILDFENSKNPPEIRFNSEWWGSWDGEMVEKVFDVLSSITIAQLLERDMFEERMKKGKPISISEFLYPILQGYDSKELDADLEIGGTDQTFNMLVGRNAQGILDKKEKFVLTTPLLEGTDGRKMSKSYGNTIDITDEAHNMFGKAMSIEDTLIIKYLELTTNISKKEIEKTDKKLKSKSQNPMEAKKKLAHELVTIYHGKKAADSAQNEFERVFQQRGVPAPNEIKMGESEINPLDLIVKTGAAKSKSEARRLVEQGGVEIDKKVLKNSLEMINLKKGSIIRVGKRKSFKII